MFQWKNRLLESRVFWFISRLSMSLLCLSSGLAKLIDFNGGMAEMQAAGLNPAWLFNVLTVITLLITSAMILANRWLWLAAGIQSGFILLTIVLVHTFWSKQGAEAELALYFAIEHTTVIGGLMALAIAEHFRDRVLQKKESVRS